MNHFRRLSILAVAALALAGCGGGNDESGGDGGGSTAAALPAPVAAKAEAICRQLRREARQIGNALPRGTVPTTLAMTTDLLVAPSIPVLEGVAERLQALEPQAKDPEFELYAGLFDPIVVLAKQRLTAGEADDSTASEGYEAMLTDLGDEQRQVAARTGLRDCQVDFQHVLVSSITN